MNDYSPGTWDLDYPKSMDKYPCSCGVAFSLTSYSNRAMKVINQGTFKDKLVATSVDGLQQSGEVLR